MNKLFGVCTWYPDHGNHLIADNDRDRFAAISPAGKVFQITHSDGEWLRVSYGEESFVAHQSIFSSVSAPAFSKGQEVFAKGESALIEDIGWHFKDSAPLYFLSFSGKRSSRRYNETELSSRSHS
jgi:hypothetical protein